MRLLHSPVYATLDQVRTVWAEVSKEPRTTIRQLVVNTGIGKTKVFHILKLLKASGYISQERYGRAFHVNIPLAEGSMVYRVSKTEWATPLKQPLTEAKAK